MSGARTWSIPGPRSGRSVLIFRRARAVHGAGVLGADVVADASDPSFVD
jgi:hypothetical protein